MRLESKTPSEKAGIKIGGKTNGLLWSKTQPKNSRSIFINDSVRSCCFASIIGKLPIIIKNIPCFVLSVEREQAELKHIEEETRKKS